jgi:DHA2 family metal-tetracycline-proton antiporter-like MFS transporter
LFALGSGSLIACFVLLSSFTGISPLAVSLFLMFGNVGQSFLQIAMSGAVSRSLPKDQVGIGMGLFSMAGFIAQGVGAGLFGIATSARSSAISWNPLHTDPGSAQYGNIYLVLAAAHVVILLLYRWRFRTKPSGASAELAIQHK